MAEISATFQGSPGKAAPSPRARLRSTTLSVAALAVFCVSSAAKAEVSSEDPTICTDRPTNANAVCTTPAGRFQFEADLTNRTRARGDVTTVTTISVANTTLKRGLDDRSDIQLIFSPFVQIATEAEGRRTTRSSVSDLTLRYKRRLSRDGARWAYAVIPALTLPSASDDVGQGGVSAGIAVPVSRALTRRLTASISPQIDLLPDADDQGRPVAIQNLINLGFVLTDETTIFVEWFARNEFAPSETTNIYTADFAIAHLVRRKVQIDAGANVGLNDAAPDLQVYAGLSVMF